MDRVKFASISLALVMVSISSILSMDNSNCASLANEKVLYFKFDEGTGNTVKDRTTKGNDGTMNNGPVRVNGPFGQAMSFDGSDDFVRVSDSNSLDPTSAFTVEAWINATSYSGDGEKSGNVIACKWDSSPDGQYALCAYSGGNLEMWLSDGSTFEIARGTGLLTAGKWQHVVATYDGMNVILYVDGIPRLTNATTITSLYASEYTYDDVTIGFISSPTLHNWYFSGKMDEVSIYNYALSLTEVRNDYHSLVGRLVTNTTVASWGFDEGSGSLLNDGTPYGNDGSILGAQFTKGISGTALVFDGNSDDISVSDSDSLDVRYGLTIEGWIMPKDLSGDGKNGGDMIASKWSSTKTGQYRLYASEGGSLNFEVSDGITQEVLTADNAIDSRQWHHIAAVWQYKAQSIYVDGTQVATKVSTLGEIWKVEFTSDHLEIGSDSRKGTTWAFSGMIDELSIRNYAMKESEVLVQYNKYQPWEIENETLCHWGFDSVSGNTAFEDLNGQNGIVEGAHWDSGLIGNSLSFESVGDKVTAPDSPITSFIWGITVSAWIRPDTLSGNADTSGNMIVAKWDSSPTGEFGLAAYSGGYLTFFLSDGENWDQLFVAAGLKQGKWSHVAATWDGYDMKVFVNGVQKGSQASTLSYLYQDQYVGEDFKIGYLKDPWSFKGAIDEVYLMNYAADPKSFLDNYTAFTPLDLPQTTDLNIVEDNAGNGMPDLYDDGITYVGDTIEFSVDAEPFTSSLGSNSELDLLTAKLTIDGIDDSTVHDMTLDDDRESWIAEFFIDEAGTWDAHADIYEKRYTWNDIGTDTVNILAYDPLKVNSSFDINIDLDEDEILVLNLRGAFIGGGSSDIIFGDGNTIEWPKDWKVLDLGESEYSLQLPKDWYGSAFAKITINDTYAMVRTFQLNFTVAPVDDPFVVETMVIDSSKYTAEWTLVDTGTWGAPNLKSGWCVNFTGLEDNPINVSLIASDIEDDILGYDCGSIIAKNYTTTGQNEEGFIISPETNFSGDLWIPFSVWDKTNDPSSLKPVIWYLHLNLTPVNDPPEGGILTIGPVSVMAGDNYTLEAQASDIDGDKITFVWKIGDKKIGEGSRIVIMATDVGIFEVDLSISDGTVDVKVGSVEVNVTKKPDVAKDPPFKGYSKQFNLTDQKPILFDVTGDISKGDLKLSNERWGGGEIDIISLKVEAVENDLKVTLTMAAPPILADTDYANGAIYSVYFVKGTWTEPAFEIKSNLDMTPPDGQCFGMQIGMLSTQSLTYGSIFDPCDPVVSGNSITWTLPQSVLVDAGISTKDDIHPYAQVSSTKTEGGKIIIGFDSIGQGYALRGIDSNGKEDKKSFPVIIFIIIIAILTLIVFGVIIFVLTRKKVPDVSEELADLPDEQSSVAEPPEEQVPVSDDGSILPGTLPTEGSVKDKVVTDPPALSEVQPVAGAQIPKT